MTQKTALVTGLRGQDGSIAAEQLLAKGYKVYGMVRRTSSNDLGCASTLVSDPNLEVVEGDLLDFTSLLSLIKRAKPDIMLGLAAQSHVGTSFEQPIYTAQATGLGVLNCLEAIKQSGIFTRFLQASSSEQFGGISDEPSTEETPFHPRSPYACAKVFGFDITRCYRESYKMFACSSICHNHEAPGKRGPNFVTRKITLGIKAIKEGKQSKLYLGNLKAKRDWGYAADFVRGMIMILESSWPDDYILATGETHTVEEFCELAFNAAGLGNYKQYVEIDPRFFRPAEVNVLVGDYTKINNALGWKPEVTFCELVDRMVKWDLNH